jgi:hypothetical protein
MIHNPKAQVIVDKIFIVFVLHNMLVQGLKHVKSLLERCTHRAQLTAAEPCLKPTLNPCS